MSSKRRDMTRAEFDKKCQERGFKRTGFLGYYRLNDNLSVSIMNAGPTRREQLAYLIQALQRHERMMAENAESLGKLRELVKPKS